MKKFFVIILLLCGFYPLYSQNQDSIKTPSTEPETPLFRKGSAFVFWGWNRASFTDSKIHFKGADYDFYLEKVVAHDRPTKLGWDYINPAWITVVQFNARIGYFVKDNLAIVLASDHMKYVMDQNQTVQFSGNISDPLYAGMVNNGQVDLSNAEFLTFEHTDGLNYINAGVEKYRTILNKKNINLSWDYGIGAGVMLPKSNIKLFGFERSDRFHIAGFGLDTRGGLNAVFWKHFMARIETKLGYINMFDIKTTLNNKPDKASQSFVFAQFNFGVGYVFQTKKIK